MVGCICLVVKLLTGFEAFPPVNDFTLDGASIVVQMLKVVGVSSVQ